MFTKYDTCFKMQKILRDEINDPEFLEFAIDNFLELFGYINTGRVNIRIHRDIEGKMWFGVGWMKIDNHTTLPYCQVNTLKHP